MTGSSRGPAIRMTATRALGSELIRLRRSPLVALHMALAVLLGGAAGAYLSTSAWDAGLSVDAFVQAVGCGAPLFAGLSCGIAIDSEREAGELANVLGVPSRRLALLAKLLVLLLLGVLAAALATAVFCACMAAAGRALPTAVTLAIAVAGMAVGSLPLYLLLLVVSLRWGRNAAVGLGALGAMVAVAGLGGLANGLVTGTLSGSFGAQAAALVPFSWPSRLASLRVELWLAAAHPPADALVQALVDAYRRIAASCLVSGVFLTAAGLALADRFEDVRRSDD